MVPTNFQQKSARVVHVQFVPRYVQICFLASNLLQHAVPVFTKKNRFGSLGNSKKTVYLRFNVDGNLHGNSDIMKYTN